MSGFGGGFGTPSPAPFAGGFGQQQQQQQQQPTAFGNPFGAPQQQQQQQPTSSFGGVFGAPTGSPSSGSFGNPATSGFLAPSAAAPAGMTFGSSPNVAAPAPSFGPSSTALFGQSSSTFGTSSGLGNTNTAFGSSTNAFGSTNTQAPTPSFGASTTSGFPSSSTFGASSSLVPSGSGFGSGTSFGASTQPSMVASRQAGPFASTNAGPDQQQPGPFDGVTSSAPNPFGAYSSTTTAPVSFGMSNNVVNAANDTDMNTASPTPFFGSPMQQLSDSEDMADSSPAPASNLPFATPAASSTWPSAPVGNALSPIPEMSDQNNISLSPPPIHNKADDGLDSSNQEEKLARLKAKLEEKKKKLEERRRKEAAAKSTSLRAEATPFVPQTGSTFSSEAKSALAERNLLRFATKPPATTQSPARSPVPSTTNNERPVDRESLANAKTLIGTCQTMCPDEELARREREGDIQLLEIPQPGSLHPQHWTLRDTAVKRFRRSAADYKLDVPEWVRPPDVLENVCGYLEEWVMVRSDIGISSIFIYIIF